MMRACDPDGATRASTSITRRKSKERIDNASAHALPIAPRRLTKQPRSRIPARAVGIEKPAPVRQEWKHDPDRLCECAREMGHRGVNRNHQIKRTDRGSHLRKIDY